MQREAARTASGGFTLVEVLAAFAVASAIIVASIALIHNVAFYFDRGTRGVGDGERLMLAVERLAGDFGSARFVSRPVASGSAAAFIGDPGTGESPAKIMFVGAGAIASGPQRDEVVTLTTERDGEVARLVRRRSAWLGPRTRFEDVAGGDPVILLEGRFDIAFMFASVTPEGALTWRTNWGDQTKLPRYVRLILRNRATGSDLLDGTEFAVRADAPAACAQAEATEACLSGADAKPDAADAAAQSPTPRASR